MGLMVEVGRVEMEVAVVVVVILVEALSHIGVVLLELQI